MGAVYVHRISGDKLILKRFKELLEKFYTPFAFTELYSKHLSKFCTLSILWIVYKELIEDKVTLNPLLLSVKNYNMPNIVKIMPNMIKIFLWLLILSTLNNGAFFFLFFPYKLFLNCLGSLEKRKRKPKWSGKKSIFFFRHKMDSYVIKASFLRAHHLFKEQHRLLVAWYCKHLNLIETRL